MPEPDATARLIARLVERGLTVGVAESLTGGLLVAELIRIPGASATVNGGIVAYNTALKRTLLGVDARLLAEHGAVHAEVAAQMASGIRSATAVDGRPADLGIATTGVAGPDPQDGQPVGTAFIGIATADAAVVRSLRLDGDRAAIRAAVVRAAVAAALEVVAPAE